MRPVGPPNFLISVGHGISVRDVGAAAGRGRRAIRCTAMCSVLVFAGYAVTGFGAVRRAGSLEACGFKQAFWSLLGLRPKVTRARGRGILSVGDMEEKRTGRRGRRPLQRVRRKCAGIWRCVDAGRRGRRPARGGRISTAQKTPSVPNGAEGVFYFVGLRVSAGPCRRGYPQPWERGTSWT